MPPKEESPAAGAPTNPQATPQYRTLNVKDALSYLDKVKSVFWREPQVYNRFLDIMKEFKTNTIDTPGVIHRVSSLFRGHAKLIKGFQTFLPPGYLLECIEQPLTKDMELVITTPAKATIKHYLPCPPDMTWEQRIADPTLPNTTAPTVPTQLPSAPSTAVPPPVKVQTSSQQPPQAAFSSIAPSSASTSAQQQPPSIAVSSAPAPQPIVQKEAVKIKDPALRLGNLPVPTPTTAAQSSSGAQVVATPGAASILGIQNPSRPLVEFNHAINYVNKIKNRFQHEPSIYKIFLEILQTYQREQKPITEVYAQVTQLFSTAPDLLEEFKQFLPETSGVAASGGALQTGDKRPAPPLPGQPRKKPKTAASQAMSVGLTAAAQSQEDKRRTKKTQGTGGRPGRKKANYDESNQAVSPPPQSSFGGESAGAALSPFAKGQTVPVPGQPLVSIDELAFFDRAKRHIDSKVLHQDFLKLLNLFTQDLIDIPTLVDRAWLFLGNSDALFSEFKSLVGWDPTTHGLIDNEEWMVENVDALDRPRIDLLSLKPHGPSYKRLPASEVELACSGRDALCWSVLNDDWVAHATWASEGSGAHKKNLSEEALAFSEQERHWFSVVMECNSRAIAILDPVCARIDVMDPEDRKTFKLNPGFGGTHASVVERAIKKIYGSDALGAASGTRTDHASELIQALYEAPGAAIPIILSRMKQKDQDWKRALKEWDKVWREVDSKNFYRSLDHQSVAFKVNDKKTLTTKSLTQEIDQLRKDQHQKQVAAKGPLEKVHPTRARYQFELHIDDKSVLFDMLKLTLVYLDRSHAGFTGPEKERIEGFLRLFTPLVFGVTKDDVDQALGPFLPRHADEEDDDEEEIDSEMETSDPGASATEDQSINNSRSSSPSLLNGPRRPGPRAIAADLRRRLLSSSLKQLDGQQRQPTAPSNQHVDEHASKLGQISNWIQANPVPYPDPQFSADNKRIRQSSPTKSSPNPVSSPSPLPVGESIGKRHNFFVGSTLYCLVRTLHIFYHRLLSVKTLAAEHAKEGTIPRLSPFAIELGLANPLPVIDIPVKDGTHPAEHYYAYMLELCEKLFDNELDASQFEEYLRYMWGIKAFPMFTVDKLASALLKYTHTVNSDATCQDMMLLLETDRRQSETTIQQQVAYRMEVEALLSPDDSLYRIEWIPENDVLAIQLLGKSDLTVEDNLRSEVERFEYYISSYTLSSPTEGISKQVKAPLLKRNFKSAKESGANEIAAYSNEEVCLGLKSFKLFHVAQTGNCLVRRAASQEEEASQADLMNVKRQQRFASWFQEVGKKLAS